jgi:acyl carrier protein
VRRDSTLGGDAVVDSDWVDKHVLADPGDRVCRWFDQPVAHVLGPVGGLPYGLAADVTLVVPIRKEGNRLMATADEVIKFTIKSLEEMNFIVEGIGLETMIGPSGMDLDSLAVAELAARLEDSFGVSFPEDEVEQLAIMTLGEFADTVAKLSVQIQPEGAPG